MQMMRKLRAMSATEWTSETLAERFKVSPEAVRRILKSNWRADEELEESEPFPLAAEASSVNTQAISAWMNSTDPSSATAGASVEQGNNRPPATPLRSDFKLNKSSTSYRWARSARSVGQ